MLYVPDLKQNLFSVGAITDKKFLFHSYHDRCNFRNGNGTLSAEGVRYLLRMLFNKISGECNVAQQNSLKLWRERLDHINVKSIKETDEARAVEGMKIENGTYFFCEVCVKRKQAQKSHFSSKREKAETPGEMIGCVRSCKCRISMRIKIFCSV